MAFCTNCGSAIPDTAKFCTECGAPQRHESAAPIPEAPAYTEIPYTPEPPRAPALDSASLDFDRVSSTPSPAWDPERKTANRRRARDIGFLVIIVLLAVAVVLLIFGNRGSGSSASGVSLSATPASVASTDALEAETLWYGHLDINGHAGSGQLENGTREIWGYIGSVDGANYFELYENPSPSDDEIPVLSMWVTLYEDRMVPLIGDHDAWFFDEWLDQRDEKTLTLTLEDGRLSADFYYYDGSESCDISFSVVQTRG